jgi:hypothetical protein
MAESLKDSHEFIALYSGRINAEQTLNVRKALPRSTDRLSIEINHANCSSTPRFASAG